MALALVLSQLVSHFSQAAIEVDQRALLGHVAQALASRLDQQLRERAHQVEFLAALDVVRNPAAPPAAKRAVFEALQRSYPF